MRTMSNSSNPLHKIFALQNAWHTKSLISRMRGAMGKMRKFCCGPNSYKQGRMCTPVMTCDRSTHVPLLLRLGIRVGMCAPITRHHRSVRAHLHALLSTLLATDMEVRVCLSLTEQQCACTPLRVCITDGVTATFEATNFMHFPIYIYICNI